MSETRDGMSGSTAPTERVPTPEDVLYPQYSVNVVWPEDNERGNNSASLHRMFKVEEDPGVEGLERQIREEWWPEYQKNNPDTVKPTGAPEITVTAEAPESWVLTWFQHWTFDVGQSDAEALASFQRYVDRYAHMQDHYKPWEYFDDYRCLMGAEDRWRWSGEEQGDGKPCRCEHCKAQGVLRIGH